MPTPAVEPGKSANRGGEQRLFRWSFGLSVAVLGLVMLDLCGWLLRIRLLTSVLPG